MNISSLSLRNYEINTLIYQSVRTLVYRGRKINDGQPVAIKLMQREYPTFNELVQFRNQYAIAKNVSIEGIVKPYALERYQNRYALIMEDSGGISLAEYYQNSTLALPEFLSLGIQLSRILHQLHQHRVIHKDIKPANILIHPETKEVQLIDFSISSLLPKETQTLQTPNVLEGTLAYISPEQTGRMNRGIDYRSDFYSLGVTFYELLNGNLPFETNDSLELVHCHIAKTPPAINSQIPSSLRNIVMKLMAKNAEDRYQSALGLKYDLEKCFAQWQEKGTIELFELGKRDLSDRFCVPEKLYGRETEVQTLLDAFERVTSPDFSKSNQGEGSKAEIILVAGYSGIGKTAIINEVHKPITRQKGYFIKGKFDQFSRSNPFSAFVQAFRDLIGQLLGEFDEQLQRWKAKILEAVGENGQVLIEVIPELERIIGEQPPVPELEGNAAQNRFNLLFEKFIAIFTTKEHPLTIFIDDLQWADSASLDLLKVLMGESQNGYLLLLGAYRDNEVSPTHPFILCLGELEQHNTTISTLTLSPLSISYINQLVAETLICDLELAMPLTELVHQKTQGNPFFATQFLKGLHKDGLIEFNPDLGYWECDFVRVREAALTNDVVQFMIGQLQKLPEDTQAVLKLAACIGNQFDLETLEIICNTPSEEVAAALWSALREGLVLPQSQAYKFFQGGEKEDEGGERISVVYRFLHDRVQQAAYALIEETQKKAVHLQIGQLLRQNTAAEASSARIFEIADHLNIAWELMADESERIALARLNLEAGKKAKSSTAYAAALEQYFTRGIEVLPAEKWQNYYELTFRLYRECSECEYLCGNFEKAEELFDEILEQVNSDIERAEIQNIRVILYDNIGKYAEAIETAADAVNRFGINLPTTDTEAISLEFEKELERLNNSLKFIKISELLDIPAMNDPAMVAAMKLLADLTGPTYFTNQDLCSLISLKMVNISIDYGNSESSAHGYVYWGFTIGPKLNNYKAAYEFGQLGLQLNERFNNPSLDCKIANMFGAFVNPWRNHLEAGIPVLRRGVQIGSEILDVWATYNGYHLILQRILCAEDLNSILEESKQHLEFCNRIKSHIFSLLQKFYQGIVLNLKGLTLDKFSLSFSSNSYDFNEEECLQEWKETNFMPGVVPYYIFKAQIFFSYREYEKALEMIEKSDRDLVFISGIPSQANHYMYYSLILMALYAEADTSQQREYEEIIAANQEKMKLWADNCSENFLHKYTLVEAERARIAGQYLKAMDDYDRAIAAAKENGYIQEEALANELAAQFYLNWGKEKFAAVHLQASYYCYAQWEAKAKMDDLQQCYPELLKSIVENDRNASKSGISISKITSNYHSKNASISSISSILDFSSLLKASQILSGEIELDRLVSTLMKIIIENAGATKGALLLIDDEGLKVEAIATRTHAENDLTLDSLNQSIPLENYSDLPAGLINTVRRTTETALLDAKTAQTQFATDNYLLRFSPQSLLCMPLLGRGNLIGILYLENHLTANAFTMDRIEVLDALCAQAAISLTNARLYEQAQQALTDLQQAQLQLVQSEKMSALGNLLAGVAHEINNPVAFIAGNIDPAQHYLEDLFGLIDLYQQEYPQPTEVIEEEIETIDLEFLREDLPQLIASMREGTDRIRHISTSLRTFSRTDKEHQVPFNVHDGLDSTLLILKHRLKANEERPDIEIIKEYGQLPEVQCFPGQLNQVFMNLIANAIDALDEGNNGRSFDEIAARPNQIEIRTFIEHQQVKICIKDNGTGMPEEVQERIFEQGFTTKGVGKGTGLGMAIALSIIEEKHGGRISCHSELGKGTEFAIAIPLHFPG
ncbi:trifunctional serine/threonine-protein kinase/ATP-binding protein/sensor histidine kinase [Roseofilum casamattae]|uniref:histidine kinase n=1 Tax=Roseofilum casamattae BLCC-M143 TaxID=3022442 RepID=A0ABT7BUK8_9CYAN|nr:ATP-binding sensor histidine kinase [Roseofilum casamattae]MDJ1182467.1 AAA family ATPase [Roseofilum casamattae BLCC-M143]